MVTEVKKGPDGKLEATLKGSPKVSIKVVANDFGTDKVDKLTAGKTTVIRAEGCDYSFDKNLITLGKFIATDLEPGKTPEPPGPKQMKFTVESLARDVAENRNNFAIKYAGNEAVISGIVEQVKRVKTVTTVDFLTNSKVKVSATFVGGKITATKGGTIEFRVQIENYQLEGMDIRFLSAKLVAQ